MPADIEPVSVAAGRRSSTGSTAPGLGIELNEAAVSRLTVR